ncbi:MAG: hypothetical protein A2103_00525 [Gammaproteobacteria bacterium GWF2_41_13]|nr:MAG: hypothetical protein A2103_00525 [Gammaproteobacteria bacterium GWF2_41_13]
MQAQQEQEGYSYQERKKRFSGDTFLYETQGSHRGQDAVAAVNISNSGYSVAMLETAEKTAFDFWRTQIAYKVSIDPANYRESGTTYSMAVAGTFDGQRKIVTGNVGDSRTYAVTKSDGIYRYNSLTQSHNFLLESERKRMLSAWPDGVKKSDVFVYESYTPEGNPPKEDCDKATFSSWLEQAQADLDSGDSAKQRKAKEWLLELRTGQGKESALHTTRDLSQIGSSGLSHEEDIEVRNAEQGAEYWVASETDGFDNPTVDAAKIGAGVEDFVTDRVKVAKNPVIDKKDDKGLAIRKLTFPPDVIEGVIAADGHGEAQSGGIDYYPRNSGRAMSSFVVQSAQPILILGLEIAKAEAQTDPHVKAAFFVLKELVTGKKEAVPPEFAATVTQIREREDVKRLKATRQLPTSQQISEWMRDGVVISPEAKLALDQLALQTCLFDCNWHEGEDSYLATPVYTALRTDLENAMSAAGGDAYQSCLKKVLTKIYQIQNDLTQWASVGLTGRQAIYRLEKTIISLAGALPDRLMFAQMDARTNVRAFITGQLPVVEKTPKSLVDVISQSDMSNKEGARLILSEIFRIKNTPREWGRLEAQDRTAILVTKAEIEALSEVKADETKQLEEACRQEIQKKAIPVNWDSKATDQLKEGDSSLQLQQYIDSFQAGTCRTSDAEAMLANVYTGQTGWWKALTLDEQTLLLELGENVEQWLGKPKVENASDLAQKKQAAVQNMYESIFDSSDEVGRAVLDKASFCEGDSLREQLKKLQSEQDTRKLSDAEKAMLSNWIKILDLQEAQEKPKALTHYQQAILTAVQAAKNDPEVKGSSRRMAGLLMLEELLTGRRMGSLNPDVQERLQALRENDAIKQLQAEGRLPDAKTFREVMSYKHVGVRPDSLKGIDVRLDVYQAVTQPQSVIPPLTETAAPTVNAPNSSTSLQKQQLNSDLELLKALVTEAKKIVKQRQDCRKYGLDWLSASIEAKALPSRAEFRRVSSVLFERRPEDFRKIDALLNVMEYAQPKSKIEKSDALEARSGEFKKTRPH